MKQNGKEILTKQELVKPSCPQPGQQHQFAVADFAGSPEACGKALCEAPADGWRSEPTLVTAALRCPAILPVSRAPCKTQVAVDSMIIRRYYSHVKMSNTTLAFMIHASHLIRRAQLKATLKVESIESWTNAGMDIIATMTRLLRKPALQIPREDD